MHWKAREQSTVALASTETEYLVSVMGIKDLRLIQTLCKEMNIPIRDTTVLLDDQAAVQMTKSKLSTPRTKHLDIRLQFVKQIVKQKRLTLQYVEA